MPEQEETKRPTIQSFRRQRKESAQAYQAAKLYFELGADRSLSEVSRRLGKSRTICERWSSRWEWVVRAEDWDLHQLALEDSQREKQTIAEAEKWAARRLEIKEEGWNMFRALKEKAEQMLKFPLVQIEKKEEDGVSTTIVKPANWTFSTASNLADTALKIGRLTAELTTENIGLDVSKLSVKQLELLIAGKPVEVVLAAEEIEAV